MRVNASSLGYAINIGDICIVLDHPNVFRVMPLTGLAVNKNNVSWMPYEVDFIKISDTIEDLPLLYRLVCAI